MLCNCHLKCFFFCNLVDFLNREILISQMDDLIWNIRGVNAHTISSVTRVTHNDLLGSAFAWSCQVVLYIGWIYCSIVPIRWALHTKDCCTADTFPAQATAVNNLNHTVLLGSLPKNGVQNSTKLLKARRFFKPLMKKMDTNFNLFSFLNWALQLYWTQIGTTLVNKQKHGFSFNPA